MNRYLYPTFKRPRVFKYSGECFWSFGGLSLQEMMASDQPYVDVMFSPVEDGLPIAEEKPSSKVYELNDSFEYQSKGFYRCHSMIPLKVFEYLTDLGHTFVVDL